MKKYTQKELRSLISSGAAIDITSGTNKTRKALIEKEGTLSQVGYSSGIYGCNGLLLVGDITGTLYAVAKRTAAIFIFG